MTNNAAISLTTGLEDSEKVAVAFPVAVGAAESGRETPMFLFKEAVRLTLPDMAKGVACDGCARREQRRVESSDPPPRRLLLQ